jgi:hypothetical protein
MRLARRERRLDGCGSSANRSKCVDSKDRGERQSAHAHAGALKPFAPGENDIIDGWKMFATVFV